MSINILYNNKNIAIRFIYHWNRYLFEIAVILIQKKKIKKKVRNLFKFQTSTTLYLQKKIRKQSLIVLKNKTKKKENK